MPLMSMRGKTIIGGAHPKIFPCALRALPGGYSVVDPYLLVFYQWGGRVGLDMKDSYPAWRRLTDQTSQRPAVQRVLAHEKITLP
jgi:hypothetical protein